jgi:hypothetical protein
MANYKHESPVQGKSADELYAKVSEGIERFLGKVPMMDNYELDRDAAEKVFRIDSKPFKGVLACRDGIVTLEGKLSLFAAPFKSKLSEGLDRWLSKTFSS